MLRSVTVASDEPGASHAARHASGMGLREAVFSSWPSSCLVASTLFSNASRWAHPAAATNRRKIQQDFVMASKHRESRDRNARLPASAGSDSREIAASEIG